MPSDIKLTQLHKTCYAGASWEMSIQYPFMMAIKRSEPWWASPLEDDVIPLYYSPHLSLRQLCLPHVRQQGGLVSQSLHLLCRWVHQQSRVHFKCPTYQFFGLLDYSISQMSTMWMEGDGFRRVWTSNLSWLPQVSWQCSAGQPNSYIYNERMHVLQQFLL